MRPKNNFDTLRILAALTVMASHSFLLSYGTNDLEPLFRLSRQQTTGGRIAVCVFFIISGYLITQSFERSRNARTFVIARALRLLPGLAVVLIVLALLIGPIVSTVPIAEYFASAQPYQFIAITLSLLDHFDRLPGVFLSNPFADQVDGSLWTLQYEVQCYMLVLCLGVFGILNRYTTLGLLFAGCLAMKFWLGGDRVVFSSYFIAGCVIYHWRPPLRMWIAALCSLLWLVSFLTGGFRIASVLFGSYVVIYLALAPRIRLPDLGRWGDLSYGTYVWAFPVQQIASAALGVWACWYFNLAIAIPIVLPLAWVSWHFIEAPALKLKKRAALVDGIGESAGVRH